MKMVNYDGYTKPSIYCPEVILTLSIHLLYVNIIQNKATIQVNSTISLSLSFKNMNMKQQVSAPAECQLTF